MLASIPLNPYENPKIATLIPLTSLTKIPLFGSTLTPKISKPALRNAVAVYFKPLIPVSKIWLCAKSKTSYPASLIL